LVDNSLVDNSLVDNSALRRPEARLLAHPGRTNPRTLSVILRRSPMLFLVRAVTVALLALPAVLAVRRVERWAPARLALRRVLARWRGRSPAMRGHGDQGQTTAEYALVIVGAAALALLLITWATKSDAIGKLFDFVMQQVKGRVG
jgi:hypothetical protein